MDEVVVRRLRSRNQKVYCTRRHREFAGIQSCSKDREEKQNRISIFLSPLHSFFPSLLSSPLPAAYSEENASRDCANYSTQDLGKAANHIIPALPHSLKAIIGTRARAARFRIAKMQFPVSSANSSANGTTHGRVGRGGDTRACWSRRSSIIGRVARQHQGRVFLLTSSESSDCFELPEIKSNRQNRNN